MVNLDMGYLYKKRTIEYDSKKINVYELLDYVVGISYTNTNGNNRIEIVSGKYANFSASFLDLNGNEEELVFVGDDLRDALERTNNIVDFSKIQTKSLELMGTYYIKSEYNHKLAHLADKHLLSFVKNQIESERNEEKVINPNDIYNQVKKKIIGQDDAIKKTILPLYKNYVLTNISKSFTDDEILKLKDNLFIYGPKKTGKTKIVKLIADVLNAPMVIINIDQIRDFDSCEKLILEKLQELYNLSDKDIDCAQSGIVMVDYSDEYVKPDILEYITSKLLNQNLFYVDNKEFYTSKLSVVFEGHTDESILCKKRIDGCYEVLTKHLTSEDIKSILLYSNLSPLKMYKKLFEELNTTFIYDDVIDYIVKKASGNIDSVFCLLKDTFENVMFEILAGDVSEVSLCIPTNEDGNLGVFTHSRGGKKKTKKKSKNI